MQGVAPADIVKETSSYDTVGNAYFAATIHCIPAGWRRELQHCLPPRMLWQQKVAFSKC